MYIYVSWPHSYMYVPWPHSYMYVHAVLLYVVCSNMAACHQGCALMGVWPLALCLNHDLCSVYRSH